ncbi:Tat pathway signal protein [Halostagnicola larsenii XH-48]|uniref:Tat pathway signal protein n=1 Tax=Halostagnicola larsenii XH-48 TaxID=797299 RepID=W0JPJ1_9EURY|nr:hypothetical protein [Halostagnicola larsenii]AHG00509.1 Tat pathway signal protein [Halostagnicola larsenii XH-48]
MTVPERRGLSRRDYLRAAVAVGGASAISACLDERGEVDVPSGTDDPDSLPVRQHAWNEFLETDDDGNVRPPEHHALVALSLAVNPANRSDSESSADRSDGESWAEATETVEESLRTLERAYEWSNDGLLFTIGYTPSYFSRFDEERPASVDLPEPEPLTDREDPAFDEFDGLIHLASDHPEVVLRAEEALFGDLETVNDEPVDTDLTGVFDRLEERRRTGFVGAGLPAEHTDVDGVPDSVPEEAPFFMGFRSGFQESQATEDRVTIQDGPFARGATQQLSSLDIQLDVWFEQENHAQRVMKTFSPGHDEDAVGVVGEALETSNGLTDERIASTEDDAQNPGVVGHAQKAARAREDGEPIILRRDFNTVDGDSPGLHFLSLQRGMSDFRAVRDAMTGADLDVGIIQNNGILGYIFVDRRGNYLLPPRSRRSLPTANPD